MPTSPRETILCRYRYDPLDRSMDWAPDQQASIQRFYCKSRLTTEIQGAAKCSLLQHDDQVLAQQRHRGDKVDTTLLATDQQRSVLNALDATQPHPLAYTPYGHRPMENGLLSLLGFNGERPDPVTGHYHLGNGYRQFNPVLMRFNSPDSWSPFGKGGLNAYAYCEGEPVLRTDINGHAWSFLKVIGRKLGVRQSAKAKYAATFNAKPRKTQSSIFFSNNNYSSEFGETKATAEVVYQKTTNTLHLKRTMENDKFSFTTNTKINSKGHGYQNQLKAETLTSITPNKNLATSDPDTYEYVNRIRTNMADSPLNAERAQYINHPKADRERQRIRDNFLRNRGPDDPNWMDYKSGGGVF